VILLKLFVWKLLLEVDAVTVASGGWSLQFTLCSYTTRWDSTQPAKLEGSHHGCDQRAVLPRRAWPRGSAFWMPPCVTIGSSRRGSSEMNLRNDHSWGWSLYIEGQNS
jgi:hypothetical protein